jgi:predicted metal-dependent hydrolase
VHDYMKREVRADLQEAVQSCAAALGVKVKRLSIRDQSSRWGSCTSAGSLSFSWRLILAPPFVLDYLAAHEVAHLVEMNHSARFWRVVARICPSMERAKKWLDTSGNDLHRYGIQE